MSTGSVVALGSLLVMIGAILVHAGATVQGVAIGSYGLAGMLGYVFLRLLLGDKCLKP